MKKQLFFIAMFLDENAADDGVYQEGNDLVNPCFFLIYNSIALNTSFVQHFVHILGFGLAETMLNSL